MIQYCSRRALLYAFVLQLYSWLEWAYKPGRFWTIHKSKSRARTDFLRPVLRSWGSNDSRKPIYWSVKWIFKKCVFQLIFSTHHRHSPLVHVLYFCPVEVLGCFLLQNLIRLQLYNKKKGYRSRRRSFFTGTGCQTLFLGARQTRLWNPCCQFIT